MADARRGPAYNPASLTRQSNGDRLTPGEHDDHRGLTTSFDKRLKPGALTGTAGQLVKRLGQVGYIAKGVAFVVLGGLFFWAGATYDANQAGGTRHRPPHPRPQRPRHL